MNTNEIKNNKKIYWRGNYREELESKKNMQNEDTSSKYIKYERRIVNDNDNNNNNSNNNSNNDIKRKERFSFYESSRFKPNYNKNIIIRNSLLYPDGKEINNYRDNNDENPNKRNKEYINNECKQRMKSKKNKNENKNKNKYNDLIKYKLAMSYSINKRK